MKKIVLSIVLIISSFNLAFAELFEINNWNEDFPYKEERADSMKDILQHSNINELSENFVWDDATKQSHPLSFYISKVINYFLAIIWFIAVLSLIYGFSLTYTQKSNEWVKKWYKFIKIATIAIIVIWISWLFASWIFYIYNNKVVN